MIPKVIVKGIYSKIILKKMRANAIIDVFNVFPKRQKVECRETGTHDVGIHGPLT
jgi:hypothetical protein